MPAIYLFQRRTLIGGDDIQPAVVLIEALRCVQLVFFLGPIVAFIGKESHLRGSLWEFMVFDPSHSSSCRHSHMFAMLLTCYAIASALYIFAALFHGWRVVYWASQGTPTETEPRSTKVASLLEMKLLPMSIILFVVWVNGISAISFAQDYYRCKNLGQNNDDTDAGTNPDGWLAHIWWLAWGLLLTSQIAEVLVSWVFLLQHCKIPKEDRHMLVSERDLEFNIHNHELVEEMWAEQCASACECLSVASCFMFGGQELAGNAEFGAIARALADYLETRGILDVVPSDIVTGLVVLHRLQQYRLYQDRQSVLQDFTQSNSLEEGAAIRSNDPSSQLTTREDERETLAPPEQSQQAVGGSLREAGIIFNRRVADDMITLEEGARYAKFALAIYTWVLYLYVRPVTGPARLISRTGCPCCFRRKRRYTPVSTDWLDDEGRIIGDNICETHKAALLLTAELDEADLVYAQLRNGFRDNPYCILLDHRWRCVVVSIRGTFSLEDCVTDAMIDPKPLEDLGQEFGFDGTGQYCHGGVLACVRNIYRDLERHGLLDRLLLGNEPLCPGYTLRFVGHSLGAAACTVLSLMLREKYPSLRCVNYSPPGSTLTRELAVACREWCTSFVLDSDIVARLSLASMEHLRDEILNLLARIKVPKIEVARRLFVHGSLWDGDFSSQESMKRSMEEILHNEGEVPDSEFVRQLNRFRTIQEDRRQSRGITRSIHLVPPGRLVHLKKTGEKVSCAHGIAKCLTCCSTSFGSEYTPTWASQENFNEIVVSPTLWPDHFPNRMRAVMDEIASNYGLGQ